MGFFARPDLSDIQFKQEIGSSLTLSGQTIIATPTGLTLSNGIGGFTNIIATGGTNNYVLTYLNGKILLRQQIGDVNSANNGLTKSGNNIRLGGTLTGDTNIGGNHTLTFNGGSNLNTICGYQISGDTILRTSNNDINSVYIGNSSGSNGTGLNNFGVGYQTLQSNTTGSNNIGIGYQVLCTNITGSNNIGIGCWTLYSNTIGCNNIANGLYSLDFNQSGCNNIGLGFQTLGNNVIGCNNIALGCQSGYNSIGSSNVYIGTCAGFNNTTSNKLYIANSASCNLIYGDFTGNTVTLPTLLLCNTPNGGSNTDNLLVWNSTDKTVKKITASSITGTSVNSANNGLTISGQNIHLGGTLTGNTVITGNYILSFCNGAKINSICGYQISGNTVLRTSKNNLNSIYLGNSSGSDGSGLNNFGVGYLALHSNTTGSNNIANGCFALSYNTTGFNNIANGYLALYSNTTGFNNIANGEFALTNNISGSDNIANGCNALYANTSGNTNIANGPLALNCNTIGSFNIANGDAPLFNNTIGCYNIANGFTSLYKNTTGCNNIAFGLSSLYCNTTGNENIAIGDQSLRMNNGSYNVAIGYCSGYNTNSNNKLYIANSTSCNLIYGDFTGNTVTLPTLLLCNTPNAGSNTDNLLVWNSSDKCVKKISASSITGTSVNSANNGLSLSGQNVHLGGSLTGNTSICGNYTLNINGSAKLNTICGYQISGNTILRTSTNDINSIYIGNGSGSNGTGYKNIAIGGGSLGNNTTGCNNIAIGGGSLGNNTTGCNNIAIGCEPLISNTCGNNNIAFGCNALVYNTSGSDNIAQGTGSLLNNITGSNNIANGNTSLSYNTTGSNNIANGYQVLYHNTTGCNNIANGYSTMKYNSTGSNNIANGQQALWENTTGCNNIANGYFGLFNNTTGSNNIAFGLNAGYNSTGSSNVYIGTNAGYNNTKSNKLYIANNANCNLIYGDFASNTVTLPTLLLCNTPATASNSDSLLAWNSTDKCVKQVNASPILNGAYNITGITTNKTLTNSQQVVLVDTTSSSVTVTLPDYTQGLCQGKYYIIKNTACGLTNNVIIDSGSGSFIDGSRCAVIKTDMGSMQLVLGCTVGSVQNWYTIAFVI